MEVKSDRVIFADYGSTSRNARKEAFFSPFQKETGVQVISADADASKLQLFAENGRADWDLIDLDGWDIVRFSREGLIQKLPKTITPSDTVPKKWQEWATGGYSFSILIGYNTEELKTPPESWADFWDVKKFPGKRGLPSFAYAAVEAALLADGVPHDQMYPLDFDRAFAKLDELREHVLFWDSFGQGMQFLAQGSVSMLLNTNGRITILKDQSFPVDLVWNEALLMPWTSGGGVPTDAPHADAAFALLDLMAQPEPQAQYSRLTFYGPNQTAALDLLDETTREKMPNTPEHEAVAFNVDYEATADQLDEYNERYTKWLAQG
jgi:putative spermidine/putrescine transport system substrate-binding protein